MQRLTEVTKRTATGCAPVPRPQEDGSACPRDGRSNAKAGSFFFRAGFGAAAPALGSSEIADGFGTPAAAATAAVAASAPGVEACVAAAAAAAAVAASWRPFAAAAMARASCSSLLRAC